MVRSLLSPIRNTTVNTQLRIAALLSLLALAFGPGARANLVTNGNFIQVKIGGSSSSTAYGQFGSDPNGSPASGAQLTVTGWDTGGYNFVFTPGTIDGGTTGGPNTGVTTQTAGQFTNTYMWGKNNGGTTVIPAAPTGGNIIAADGAYETGAITQTVTGLTVGKTYVLKFYWAGAQQQSFTGQTTESWTVSLGTGKVAGNFSTSTVTVPSMGFSGWQSATMYFYANSTSEVLSFLAVGTPSGEPPFSLLADVDLEIVPDFSNWMIFFGFGAVCILVEVIRRRHRQPVVGTAA